MDAKLCEYRNLGMHFIPLSAVERGCRRSLTRWLADDRHASGGQACGDTSALLGGLGRRGMKCIPR